MTVVSFDNARISFIDVYQFKSITFSWHDYHGPDFLSRKTHNSRQFRNIGCMQYGLLCQWLMLSKVQRENYRIF